MANKKPNNKRTKIDEPGNTKTKSPASRLVEQINRKHHQPFHFPDFHQIDDKGLVYEKRILGEFATEIVIVELTPNKKIEKAYLKKSSV